MKAMRLHTRIAALLVLVVLGTQALTFIAVQVATERSVKAQLGEELQIGERVWQRINLRRDEQLLQSASVLAEVFAGMGGVSLSLMGSTVDMARFSTGCADRRSGSSGRSAG